jgi:6-phosphogluconolactonase/glucosamine-6-phosphate isomerase/deaminase
MINYIQCEDSVVGQDSLANKLCELLNDNKKVLWLICGGSNIATAVKVMDFVQNSVSVENIKNLKVMQTDERYGPIGHKDSNWQQMSDQGFNFKNIEYISILRSLSLDQTIEQYGIDIEKAFGEADIIVAELGIGGDGHIGGILPHTSAVRDTAPVTGYEASPFTRISISFPYFRKIDIAYVFAFGSSKQKAIEDLKNKQLSLDDEPCQILKEMKEVYFYSDM